MKNTKDGELSYFLEKVNNIESMVKELNSVDELEQKRAIERADKFLERKAQFNSSGFDKTVINKKHDETPQFNSPEMSPEEFMKKVETDAQQRHQRKSDNAKSAATWKSKGNEYFSRNQFHEAVDCYSEAIKLTPDDIVFYTNRAQAKLKLGNYAEAHKDAETALKLDKKHVKSQVILARSLAGVYKFDEATSTLEDILKIDRKQTKIVNSYLKEIEDYKRIHLEEKKVQNIDDDSKAVIKKKINSLRKGCTEEKDATNVLEELNSLITTADHRVLFRIYEGFKILHENTSLKSNIKTLKSKVVLSCLIELLLNISSENERNTELLCNEDDLVNILAHSLSSEADKTNAATIIYQSSQYAKPRALIVNSIHSKCIVSSLFDSLGGGSSQLNLLAARAINNFALDSSFVPKFEEKLIEVYIPRVVKIMELITTIPTLGSSFRSILSNGLNTLTNVFHNKQVRDGYSNDMQFWSILLNFIKKCMNDKNCGKLIEDTFGMFLNLTISKTNFSESIGVLFIEICRKIPTLSSELVIERLCGVINHVINENKPLQTSLLEGQSLDVLNIYKTGNAATRNYWLKCLALLTNQSPEFVEKIFKADVHTLLLQNICNQDETVIANSAICLSHCALNKNIAATLSNTSLIADLLKQCANENLAGNVRHNCSLAIVKFTQADPRYLDQLRDLNGLEILHGVMRTNNLI